METRSQDLPWNSGASLPEIYNLSLQSPTGEILDISASLGAVTQELSFVFVETRVKVNYVSIERQTGYTLVYFQLSSRHLESGVFLSEEEMGRM